MLARCGELPRSLQQHGAAVHLTQGLDEQVGDRRVQVGARDQLNGRRDQVEVGGGEVLAEVYYP